AWSSASHLASGAWAIQGLHRHGAPKSLSIAAHYRTAWWPAAGSTDSNTRNASHRGRRRGGALEIQRRKTRLGGRKPTSHLDAPVDRVVAGTGRARRFLIHIKGRFRPGGGLCLHSQGPRFGGATRGQIGR